MKIKRPYKSMRLENLKNHWKEQNKIFGLLTMDVK
jgi:hypothetical protein